MYIVNISFMVSATVHSSWYDFMTNRFLKAIEQEERIENFVLSKVLFDNVQDSFTYSLQLNILELSHYIHLRRNLLPDMKSLISGLYDTEVMHFVTVMKIVHKGAFAK